MPTAVCAPWRSLTLPARQPRTRSSVWARGDRSLLHASSQHRCAARGIDRRDGRSRRRGQSARSGSCCGQRGGTARGACCAPDCRASVGVVDLHARYRGRNRDYRGGSGRDGRALFAAWARDADRPGLCREPQRWRCTGLFPALLCRKPGRQTCASSPRSKRSPQGRT